MKLHDIQIVAIVGMCGSGKSTIVDLLEKKWNLDIIYLGEIVFKEMERLGLESTPENQRKVQQELRDCKGKDVLAKKIIPLINSKSKNIILDGVYSTTEYETLKEEYGDRMICIAIHANKNIRYARLNKRTSRPLTKEEVDKRDMSEIKNIEKGGPIGLADYHIVNNGDMKDLELQLENIFNNLL